MHDLLNFLSAHQLVIEAGMLWILSAAISTMPEPTPQDSMAYTWLYRLMHLVAANLDKVWAFLPGGNLMAMHSFTKMPEEK